MVAEQLRVVAIRLTLLGVGRKEYGSCGHERIERRRENGHSDDECGVALARDLGKLTLLIDADLKAPKVHAYTGISSENELLDLLKRREEHVDVVDRFAHRITKPHSGLSRQVEARRYRQG